MTKKYFAFSEYGSLKRALRKIREGKHDDNECKRNCEANRSLFNCQPYNCPFIERGNEITKLLGQAKVSSKTVMYSKHLFG